MPAKVLLFLEFQYKTTLVVPAIWAGPVSEADLGALRTSGQGRCGNGMVSPSLIASGLGCFSFGYTHRNLLI
jgi:hypothetical protein